MCKRLATLLLMLNFVPAAWGADVWLVEFEGAVSPASADYLIRTLEHAEQANADLLIIRMDTPGGLDQSMRDIIKQILAAKVPVATFVAPDGSRAASAGTYILYASHFAAMAPATNVGSSTPVSIGGGGSSPFPLPGQEPKKPASEEEDESESKPDDGAAGPKSAMERKIINDAVAYLRGLAQLRGRNQEWAEKTVREGANLPAADALEQDVIDVIATDVDDLLAKLNGKTVTIEGQERTLDLSAPNLTRIEPDWRHKFLALITNPNVAYILLMIGIYGLIIEFYNPGLGGPGIVGVICLLLGAFALHMLPINYAGLALMLVGVALMVAEAFTPTFGVLGLGGAIAFVIGSIMLMDTELPAYQISLPIIAAFAAASIGLFVFAVGAAFRARRGQVVTGKESMIGTTAVVLENFDGTGRVRAFGEIWQATSEQPLTKGATVRIVKVDGLTLKVEPRD
ncbi:MAG: nodulation protein NfeD [Gammaproteobacteria bacterium]|nr:nodulation protein NfeD [Gammaproteobacteria bacterium]